MTTIQNFEDLKSWKKARELAGCICELTHHEKFSRDYGLRDQIQRAASSVMHNIAEGFESGSDPEFVRFVKMARRSAGEVQFNCTWLWTLAILLKRNGKKPVFLLWR